MLTNIMCRRPGPCTTLLNVSTYYPRTLNSHGKLFLSLSNPVLQKCNITSTRLHARVLVLKNYQNSLPASTQPEFFPKNLRNYYAEKTAVKKLENPENSDDINITVSPNHSHKAPGRRISNHYFKQNTEFCLQPRDALADRIRVLKQHGITQDRIEVAPHLLLRDFEELEALANDIARILNVPFRCAIPLTNIPIRFWERVSRKWRKEVNELEEFKGGKFRNRMEYLADRLKLSTEDIAYMISQSVQISLHPIGSLNSNIEILKVAGVRSEDIYSDPYILIHGGSPSMIQLLKIHQEYEIEEILGERSSARISLCLAVAIWLFYSLLMGFQGCTKPKQSQHQIELTKNLIVVKYFEYFDVDKKTTTISEEDNDSTTISAVHNRTTIISVVYNKTTMQFQLPTQNYHNFGCAQQNYHHFSCG